MLRAAVVFGGLLAVDAVSVQAQRPLVRRDAGSTASAEQQSDSAPPDLQASLAQRGAGDEAEAAAGEDTARTYVHNKASAQEVNNMMQVMDVDKDGKLSWLEVIAFFNREGGSDEITQQELEAGGFGPMTDAEKKELKEVFDMSDDDGDGLISKEELARFLSAQEAQAEHAAQDVSSSGEAFGDGGIDGDEEGESLLALEDGELEHQGLDEAAARDAEAMASFNQADSNKDGSLTLEEVLSHIEREEAIEREKSGGVEALEEDWKDDAISKFKVADKDKSGALSADEFKSLIQEDDEVHDENEDMHEHPEDEEHETDEDAGKSEDELFELGGDDQEEDEALGAAGAPGR